MIRLMVKQDRFLQSCTSIKNGVFTIKMKNEMKSGI